MKTITKSEQIKVQDNSAEAIKWLESEYPRGLDLVYIDYRDSYEDMAQLQRVLKDGADEFDAGDYSYETIDEVMKNYLRESEADELSDEVREAMQEWLQDHDTSDPQRELLKHTGSKLFYIETRDYSNQNEAINTGTDPRDYKKLVKKYGKTDAQAKAVKYVLDNQFYGAPVSFYFYADVEDVYNVIHGKNSKYIGVSGAYFSTVDRVQGSNWLGEDAIFTITIPREDLIKNVYLDEAKGTGYGWGEIAGQSGYDDAVVCAIATKTKGSILVQSETSEAQAREARLQAHWDKTHTCTAGDMNMKRHAGEQPYRNEYPCGNKCTACGTFWVD
jgi:hypothetical protein